MGVIFEEVFLSLNGFSQRHLLCDLLLASAFDDHVAFLQLDDLVVDYFHHHLFRAFVHQVRFGQNT